MQLHPTLAVSAYVECMDFCVYHSTCGIIGSCVGQGEMIFQRDATVFNVWCYAEYFDLVQLQVSDRT